MPPRETAEGGERVVVALDSFKGTLSSLEAGRCLARGLLGARPRLSVTVLPVADGGEGTLEALLHAWGGSALSCRARDPLGRPVEASYGMSGARAVVEMARASGLPLLSDGERDSLRAATGGTGDLMAAARDRGARTGVVAAGGSATVDGGKGALEALGFAFLDRRGRPLAPGGGSLVRLHRVERPEEPGPVSWRVACDVTNPLVGPDGAARTYGPQKGAGPAAVEILEEGLGRLADVVERQGGPRLHRMPMAGAAGGLSGGLHAFLGAELFSGVDGVLDAAGFDEALEGAALAVTGEGRVDGPSSQGKLVSRVARRARDRGVPCAVVAGSAEEPEEVVHNLGLACILTLTRGGAAESLGELRLRTPERLGKAGRELASAFFGPA